MTSKLHPLTHLEHGLGLIGLVVTAYLIGSILSALWASKLLGIKDPREYGSKNPGTTNIARSKHPNAKLATLLTLFLDITKGFVPVYYAQKFGYSTTCALLVGHVAIVGHLFPVFYNYRGGKGMATALGVLSAISKPLVLANGLVWATTYWLLRISSLSSITSVISIPFLFLLSNDLYQLTPAVMLICMFLLYKHLSNIYTLSLELYREYKQNLITNVQNLFTLR